MSELLNWQAGRVGRPGGQVAGRVSRNVCDRVFSLLAQHAHSHCQGVCIYTSRVHVCVAGAHIELGQMLLEAEKLGLSPEWAHTGN